MEERLETDSKDLAALCRSIQEINTDLDKTLQEKFLEYFFEYEPMRQLIKSKKLVLNVSQKRIILNDLYVDDFGDPFFFLVKDSAESQKRAENYLTMYNKIECVKTMYGSWLPAIKNMDTAHEFLKYVVPGIYFIRPSGTHKNNIVISWVNLKDDNSNEVFHHRISLSDDSEEFTLMLHNKPAFKKLYNLVAALNLDKEGQYIPLEETINPLKNSDEIQVEYEEIKTIEYKSW